MDLLHDTHVWVTVSFLIFCVFAFKFGKGAFLNMLDSRIEAIRKEIETAESLHVEAQELLAQYQRKQRDALKEAEGIVEHAKSEAARASAEAEAKLQETIKRRTEMAVEKIARAEAQALQDVRNIAVDVAVEAARSLIGKNLDETKAASLVDESIKDLDKKLH